MKYSIKLFSILTLLSIYSCSNNQEFKEKSADTGLYKEVKNNEQTPVSEELDISERKIIKEGEISFQTSNAKETSAFLFKVVSDSKGYISSENVYDYTDKVEHRIVIRVPAENFDLLLKNISESAKKLDSKSISVLDVTEEYIDIESRIKTKKELESRYKELLKQANKVEELLTIEKEIGKLRTEIEAIEGRLKYLSDKVLFSTLTVRFYERTSSAFGFNSKFGQAIKNGWKNLLWFIIGLTNIWPFFLIAPAIVLLVIQLNKRNRKTPTNPR